MTIACQTFLKYEGEGYSLFQSQWFGIHDKMATKLAVVRAWDSCTQISTKAKHSRVINLNSIIRFSALISIICIEPYCSLWPSYTKWVSRNDKQCGSLILYPLKVNLKMSDKQLSLRILC